MIVDVNVPVLAESIPDATLLDWNKQPGDAVENGEILVELETDKVVLEVPAPASGVLAEIVKAAGEVALSEEVIARIDTEGAAAATEAEPSDGAEAAPEKPAAAATDEEPSDDGEPKPSGDGEEKPAEAAAKLSPAVRKLVEERGVDVSTVRGTGKGGRITKGDVLAHLESQDAEPASDPAPAGEEDTAAPAPATTDADPAGGRGERRVPMTRLRARIAERLLAAQRTAAILTTFNEIDMQPVMDLRSRHRERFEEVHGVRLGFMSFFAKASVAALVRFPAVNAYIEGTDVVYHDYCDIGVAVSSPRGLLVPVLRNVERMSFADIEGRTAELGEKAADGSLTIEELSGGTFTISNGGVFGSLLSTPILNPPQSAILGMHKIQDRPVVVDDEIAIRPMMYVALSYDHRIIDGREAVQFLVAVKEALEDPGRMLLDL